MGTDFDRQNLFRVGFVRTLNNVLGAPNSPSQARRRRNFTENIRIRTARRFIPTFVDEANTILNNWDGMGEFDMVHEGLRLLVNTMMTIIFGPQFL